MYSKNYTKKSTDNQDIIKISNSKEEKEMTQRIIDLNAKIPGANDFQYKEFVHSNTATRLNIPNIPTDEQWKNIEELAINVLQPVRDEFGRIRISSGFRSLLLNEKVGGSPTSNHCFGFASDIIPLEEGVKQINILEYIYKNLKFHELIFEFPPSGWVHVAYRSDVNAMQLKLKDKHHNYTKVKLDYIKSLYINI